MCALSVVRLSNYLVRHCEGKVLEFYESLLREGNAWVQKYRTDKNVDEDQLVFYKKFLHERWNKWAELKPWLLAHEPI